MLLAEQDFYPTSAEYFCNKNVEFYNYLVIKFYSLNVPFNRLRVNHIEYGLRVDFKGTELRKAKIIQEIDPISSSIPINSFDFSIDSHRNIDFSFQAKQPLEVVVDGKTFSSTFVKSANRKSKTVWDIQSEDYIGLMDSIYFVGGIYKDKNSVELIEEIFATAKIPYEIIGDFSKETVSGHIPYTTCREALMQVLFVIGACADTSNSDKVKIFALSQEVSQNIPKRRTMRGSTFKESKRITALEITAHSYDMSEDEVVAFDASQSEAFSPSSILVEFAEPLHSLTIENGEIEESGSNYAIISGNGNCKLKGKKYLHTTTVYKKVNPLVLSSDLENIVSIENATLVSSQNVDKVFSLCYNYIVGTERTTMKIIDGKTQQSTAVGDLISFETEYLGTRSGRIVKQTFSLSGGIIIKDSEVR